MADSAWFCFDQAGAGVLRDAPFRFTYWRPVRIWTDAPTDPLTGETLERTHYTRAQLGRDDVDPLDIWTWCAGHPITEGDWRCFMAEYPERTEEWLVTW